MRPALTRTVAGRGRSYATSERDPRLHQLADRSRIPGDR